MTDQPREKNQVTNQIRNGLIAVMLASTAAVPALAQEISWIYCGDSIDPVHEKYIKDWEAANAGWTIAVEVVGWEQCQE